MSNLQDAEVPTVKVEQLKLLLRRKRRFFLYCCLGLVGVIVDLSVFWMLTHFWSFHPQIANLISTFCGILTSFFLNATYTFQSRDRLLLRAILFTSVGLVGLGFSALTLYVLIEMVGLDKTLAKVVCLYVVLVQYNLNRLVSFRQ